MATTVGVLVVDWAVDGTTGHVTVHLRGVETAEDGSQANGPLKTMGIDAESLLSLYGGDVQAFILAKKQEVLTLLSATKVNTSQLQALKGTLL